MSNTEKAARWWSNELGWVASASTGSKPASQPAATATGQLLAGGGDVGV